jgi:hypothetical protein
MNELTGKDSVEVKRILQDYGNGDDESFGMFEEIDEIYFG